uniref:Uncharacterized protein n=1 Tax=Anguilla anguilla TaxID=7936 RepID=A0A0E9RF20_ANGAN
MGNSYTRVRQIFILKNLWLVI